MTIDKKRYPSWLLALSLTQGGALLVFMSFAGALPLMQEDWGMNNTQAGVIQSAGQIGYLIAVLVIAPMTDFIDSKILIVGGAFWAGFWNLVFAGYAHNVTTAVIFRILVGLGIAGIYMPGVKFISQRTSSAQRGGSLGLFVASFTLGSAVSITVGGNLASVLGWRLAFGLTSIGPILGGLVSVFTLPTGEKPSPSVQKDQPISDLFKNKEAMIIILIYICHAWEVLGLRSWIAAYLTEVRIHAGDGLLQATQRGSTVAGVVTMIAATATAIIGAYSDRVSRPKMIMWMMGLGFLFTFSLGFSLTFSWGIVVGISLLSGFLSNADSAIISASLTEAVPGDHLGRVLAIYSFAGFSAGSISPLVFGAALDYGEQLSNWSVNAPWVVGFGTLAFVSILGFMGAQWLYRNTPKIVL